MIPTERETKISELYHKAFREFGARALWNVRELEDPTPEDALVVARFLRVEGNLEARRLAEQIEKEFNAKVSKLSPAEKQLLEDFVNHFNGYPGIKTIILYGSRSSSRSFSHEESDLDIALIVERQSDVKGLEKAIEQWNMDAVDYGLLFHPIVIAKDQLETPFGLEVMKGDKIWTTN